MIYAYLIFAVQICISGYRISSYETFDPTIRCRSDTCLYYKAYVYFHRRFQISIPQWSSVALRHRSIRTERIELSSRLYQSRSSTTLIRAVEIYTTEVHLTHKSLVPGSPFTITGLVDEGTEPPYPAFSTTLQPYICSGVFTHYTIVLQNG